MTYYLFHYFEKKYGPFRNLSSLSIEEALEISNQIKHEGKIFASQRSSDYMTIRRELEKIARDQFIVKGGKPRNLFPHYMTLGSCDWLESWYETPGKISINLDKFLEESISFTYGDLFPTMRYQDDKPYRKQVYTKKEIKDVIEKFGYPQVWNRLGDKGPERYIEVQIWDEEVLKKYI
ncbi:hypothetical protein D7Z26_00175 [Cohnella endophytica]|uniref:Uncharacterized protein n=1 Tax=Cohnella endophytica TaxID=2419778 RepID=A0A494Y5K5_9BACL|nr:hypothetical protein [Cohnella endophytica]RKP57969.1 hypothetical protein D7Z26_00175 [Cohnella endophytica]